MKVLRNVISFWKDTWKTNRRLFYAEMLGVLFSMNGALFFAFGTPDPNLLIVLISYTIGSLFIAWSSFLRESAWMLLLMSFYTATNFVGLYNLWNN